MVGRFYEIPQSKDGWGQCAGSAGETGDAVSLLILLMLSFSCIKYKQNENPVPRVSIESYR